LLVFQVPSSVHYTLDGMATAIQDNDVEAMRERIRSDFPFWAENFAKIVDKQARKIPLVLKPGQLALDEALEAQRAEGKPRRAIILKARQLGFSTYAQAKLIHESTLQELVEAMVVAQDRNTGEKLYRMGERMYANLPEDDPWLKPKLGKYRRSKSLHFAGDELWHHGKAFPDSTYSVDTAGEYEAGRGITPNRLHLSELAFWPQLLQKLTALLQGVPDTPDSLIIYESTANGYNAFRDLWQDAEAGVSEFIAFFWPWFKEPEYELAFLNDSEKEAFIVGDRSNPYAEREPELVDRHEISLEQLNWRRWTIANKCGGDLRKFDQEYPTIPEDAFISTGAKVFDPYRVGQLIARTEETDPKVPSEERPGPIVGDFAAGNTQEMLNRRSEQIEVPTEALWVPRERGVVTPSAPFRLWLEQDDEGNPLRPSEYIIGVDVSGGNTETTRETDYHAIQVIDHKTREQVGEYQSRIEPEELTPLVLLTALFFNNAWVAIERTGSWGMPVIRALFRDLHYPYQYRARKVGGASERAENRFGWHTSPVTKPELVAGMAALLKEAEDGIKSRALADQVRTYTRTEKGTTEAEPGKFDDLLMAYMIGQQVARERPLMEGEDGPNEPAFVVGSGGLSAYDSRY
jgi:hypothetical protein